ncbi:MAG: Mur ligase family protein [Anaerovoracaceae bacterium]
MESDKKPLNAYIEKLQDQGLVTEIAVDDAAKARDVGCVTYDSQDVAAETLFVCKGVHFKAEYLLDALKKGAFCYVAERVHEEAPADTPYIIVSDIRKAMPLIADLFYDKIWQKITTIGITGTKGKSSTTYFMRYILDAWMESQGKPATAVISGIDNYDGVINEESHLTTPEAMMLHKHFYNAVKSGIEYVTMEVSSQALKYDRTLGITFDVGAFLNLGEDHISPVEHPTVEDYMMSKMVLMHQCRTAVINYDTKYTDWALREAKDAEQIVTFGEREGADVFGYRVRPHKNGITFCARGSDFDEEFEIGLTGLFNVSNALAAIAMSRSLGVPVEFIKQGLRKARVDGRMEIFTNPAGTITAIVDYAHNKMSFDALFASVKEEYPGKKISIVFGCPGKKAQRRRKELGESAGRNCDHVYITEEDAGEEPVHEISLQIAEHVKEMNHAAYDIIDDRGEAIKRAIEDADENTVLLFTGKGRETRQKRGIEYIDTPSDVEYVEKYLSEK